MSVLLSQQTARLQTTPVDPHHDKIYLSQLISAFDFIPFTTILIRIASLWPSSVVVQPGLCQIRSKKKNEHRFSCDAAHFSNYSVPLYCLRFQDSSV